MTETLRDRILALEDWMFGAALEAGLDDYQEIFRQFCERLNDCGVPLLRAHVAMQTLHPMAHAISLTWYRGEDARITLYPHELESGDDIAWQQSPLKALVDSGETFVRHELTRNDLPVDRHPLLGELRDKGATDYLGFVIRLAPGDISLNRQAGMIVSLTTDRPGGFDKEHIATLRRIMTRFAVVAKLAGRERLFHNVLEAYLGPDAGQRVRRGQIALGSGQLIDAVIWFCDLRNSTPLAEKLGHENFLAMLNDYFEALAGAVIKNGGEVLRFIGDAALAIFPISDDAYDPPTARGKALSAAKEAVERAGEINTARVDRGEDPFEYGIGLHVGRIMYGNIGVPTRVEFSVIGAAANEAARVESLCKSLGEPILVSETFTEGLSAKWRDMGRHAIRGSDREIRLFTLDN